MAPDRSASLRGVSMKHLSLITLTFQNSALILVMHYSRIMPLVNGYRYHSSTSVFLNEAIKLAISATMALYEISTNLPPNTRATALVQNLVSSIFANESWKLAVPAALYTLQNTLQYVAVSNLDPSTFQVTYQLKILTTAVFSVLLLGRTLSPKRWASLLLLIVGVSIVQLPQQAPEVTVEDLKGTGPKYSHRSLDYAGDLATRAVRSFIAKRSATYEGIEEDVAPQHPQMNRSVGLIAVLISCALSGLAGVCFEKVLKESASAGTKPVSLWVRNCQLSFWSLFPALFLGVIWVDGENIAKTGFFAGYNWVVWTAIGFQAAGGIIVALVINYADNIAKNFATSISIIVSALASAYFFDFKITISYLVGTSIVMAATYLYSLPERSRPSPIKIVDFQETNADDNNTYHDSTLTVKSPTRPEGITTPRPSSPAERKFPKRDA